jgi:hypothetical protein
MKIPFVLVYTVSGIFYIIRPYRRLLAGRVINSLPTEVDRGNQHFPFAMEQKHG